MIRIQISVDEALYEAAKKLARRQGISLSGLIRRALAETVGRECGGQPWMRWAGILEGAAGDSESVDREVYGRQTP